MTTLSDKKMVIVMAGLPGTGKSAIAAELERRLNGVLLNKDEIRAELFSAERIDFSREQDDLCMKVIFIAAKYLLRTNPARTLIIDGRTFSRLYQVQQLLSEAASLDVKPAIIECVCDDAIAKQRLDKDFQRGVHPAANRSYELYLQLKEKAEPITVDHLIIDTGKESLEKSAERCLAILERQEKI